MILFLCKFTLSLYFVLCHICIKLDSSPPHFPISFTAFPDGALRQGFQTDMEAYGLCIRFHHFLEFNEDVFHQNGKISVQVAYISSNIGHMT